MKGEDRLSGTQAGFVAGAALLGLAPLAARRLLASEEEGGTCARALEGLATLSREDRSRWLAELLEQVNQPIPEGLERVHPGWLREALQAESSPVLRAITAGLPASVREVASEIINARAEDPTRSPADAVDDEALAALRRAVFGGFVPLPPGAPAVTLDQLAGEGAAVLGRSLHGAPREVVARAAAGVGEPWARAVIAGAAGPAAAREQARALVASIRPEDAGLGAVYAIGLQALGAQLAAAPEETCLAVAQQLPPALGHVLIRATDRARGSG